MRRGWSGRRVPAAIAAAIAVAALVGAGCGGGGSSSGGGGGGGGTMTIPLLTALTGPQASYGKFMANGAKMAAKDINAKGGIGGKTKIQIDVSDDQGLPQKAVTNFNQVISQHSGLPWTLTAFSSVSLALAPIAEKDNVALINGGAQNDELATTSPLLYNTLPTLRYEIQAFAPYLFKHGYKSAAVIGTDDAGGKGSAQDFQKFFTQAGGRITRTAIAPYTSSDFRSQLRQLKASNPQLLFIAAFGSPDKNIIDQAREIGWDVQLANTSWVNTPDVLSDSNAVGLIHSAIPFNPSQKFLSEYKKLYGEKPGSQFVGTYYDAVVVFAMAYERAQKNGGTIDGKAIAKAIEQIGTFPTSYGGTFKMQNRLAARPLDVEKITKGGSEQILEKHFAGPPQAG